MNRQTPVQLDLFLDSRAVILANEVINALLARDAARAAACRDRLREEEPGHHALGELDTLSRALAEWPPLTSTPAEIAEAVRHLETEVQPAARRALGEHVDQFMLLFWRSLALAAKAHPYDEAFPESHCSALQLRSGDARAALAAAQSIPDWPKLANALHWIAVARYRLEGPDACRPPLFLLAWRAPDRLPKIFAELNDALLDNDWRAFDAACDWLDGDDANRVAWFPACFLLEHPSLRIDSETAAHAAPIPPAQAYLCVERLLDLEKRGYSRALLSARARLREIAPDLFALYMARRTVNHR
jgi:hypothetical protein